MPKKRMIRSAVIAVIMVLISVPLAAFADTDTDEVQVKDCPITVDGGTIDTVVKLKVYEELHELFLSGKAADPETLNIALGESKSVKYTLTAQEGEAVKRPVHLNDTVTVTGKVTVTNHMETDQTVDLFASVNPGDQKTKVGAVTIGAGATATYDYTYTFVPQGNGQHKIRIHVGDFTRKKIGAIDVGSLNPTEKIEKKYIPIHIEDTVTVDNTGVLAAGILGTKMTCVMTAPTGINVNGTQISMDFSEPGSADYTLTLNNLDYNENATFNIYNKAVQFTLKPSSDVKSEELRCIQPPPPEPIFFEKNVTVNVVKRSAGSSDNSNDTAEETVAVPIVTVAPVVELPHTGGLIAPETAMIITGIVMVMGAAILLIKQKKKALEK